MKLSFFFFAFQGKGKERQSSSEVNVNGMPIQPTHDAMPIEHNTSGARLLTFSHDKHYSNQGIQVTSK